MPGRWHKVHLGGKTSLEKFDSNPCIISNQVISIVIV
jgi:hypothetical protein